MRGIDDKASPWVATIGTLLLEVRASILFKFSFDLIADNIKAFMELLKNSYDADTSQICANIKTQALTAADTGDIVPESYPFFDNETNSS